MGTIEKRAAGATEELGGKIKKNVGHALGNNEMESKGAAKEIQGKARQEVAKAGERVKGAVEKLKGTVRQAVNK